MPVPAQSVWLLPCSPVFRARLWPPAMRRTCSAGRQGGSGAAGYAPASELDSTLVYLSVENLSARPLAVGASYLQSRGLDSRNALYSLGTGLTALCDGRQVRVGSFAAPLYGENAADASAFTLNLSAGRGAMLHCFCETPADWQTLELIYQPDFAAGQTVHFVVRRDADEVHLGAVPATLAEVGSVSICK